MRSWSKATALIAIRKARELNSQKSEGRDSQLLKRGTQDVGFEVKSTSFLQILQAGLSTMGIVPTLLQRQ